MQEIKNDELQEVVGGGLLSSNHKFSKGDWVKIKGDTSSLTAYRIKGIIEEDDNTKCELIRYKYYEDMGEIASSDYGIWNVLFLIEDHQPLWWDDSIDEETTRIIL